MPTCALSEWRQWLRPVVMSFYLVLFLIALPLCIWELQLQRAALHVQAWFVGGLFVLFAIPISLFGILQHLVNYTQPFLQRHIIRILWMVPIYALDSWFALMFPEAAIYLSTVRECYEAYVIYNFMVYILNFLNSEHADLETTLECKPQVKHMFPVCCLQPWKMGGSFIRRCKHGVLQYTIIRPITTVIALFSEWGHVYNEGELNFQNVWSYLNLINNISQALAMYCLILFYKATAAELKPMKPLAKFMCVKFVVFMSFWQGVLIAILVAAGVFSQNEELNKYSDKRISTGIQDFCVCIEMFFAAVGHYFAFSHIPYISSGHEKIPCCTMVLTMCDVSDVHDDVYEHARFVEKSLSGAVGGPMYRRSGEREERQPLLTDFTPRRTSFRTPQNIPPIPLKQLKKEERQTANESDSELEVEIPFQERQFTDSLCNYAQFEKPSQSEDTARTSNSVSETVEVHAIKPELKDVPDIVENKDQAVNENVSDSDMPDSTVGSKIV